MLLQRILIVDDSDTDHFLLKDTLDDFSPEFEVTQAYDGREALDQLESKGQLPQVIFLDINMPRMNGFEFLDTYGGELQKKSIVVVMLTSSNQEADRAKAISYDCVAHYIEKQMTIDFIKEFAKRFETVST